MAIFIFFISYISARNGRSKSCDVTAYIWIWIDLSFLVSGTRFLCVQTVAPISNEAGDLLMFLLSFDDLSSPQEEDDDDKEFSQLLTKCA